MKLVKPELYGVVRETDDPYVIELYKKDGYTEIEPSEAETDAYEKTKGKRGPKPAEA